MSALNLKFINVSFSYNTAGEPLLSSVNFHFSRGWTGITGPNGTGKSTVAKLAAGLLTPASGIISSNSGLKRFYCEQETALVPDDASDFIYSEDTYAGKLRSQLGIRNDWVDRWHSLSHGERKRLQSGIALWTKPDILILDEPVNHVDNYTKQLLSSTLLKFDGIGIVISHEKEFLDFLCHSCLFMRPGYAILRPGNYSDGIVQQRLEDESRLKKYSIAVDKYRDTKKRAISLNQSESGKHHKLSKKNIAMRDYDAKGKIDAARLSGKDKTGARKARILEKKSEKLGEAASQLYYKQRKIAGIEFRGEKAKRDLILSLTQRRLNLGPEKKLEVPDLIILPYDRVAITGDNGSGKSTFVKYILPLFNLEFDKLLYIPQEIDESLWKEVRQNLNSLDNQSIGEMYTAVHRLGSEPEGVINSPIPSPGERRKIMLALGLLKNPHIIILDEPTNHMDISSIEALESALNIYDGALLIVSHDMTFIRNTSEKKWDFVRIDDDHNKMQNYTIKCSYL